MNALVVLPLLLVGGMLMALARPMIQRRIKPNLWYGFRTRKTLSNPEIWYNANAYSGKQLFIAGMWNLIAAIVLLPLLLFHEKGLLVYILLWACVNIGGIVWATIKSFRYLARL